MTRWSCHAERQVPAVRVERKRLDLAQNETLRFAQRDGVVAFFRQLLSRSESALQRVD
jgi:hypothetical protein